MKFFAAILVIYMSILTVSPVLCGLADMLQKVELCCTADESKQCSDEPKDSKDQSDNKPTSILCCSVQKCNCCFETPPQFDFEIGPIITSEKIRIRDESVISNYSSNCWQPPEIV